MLTMEEAAEYFDKSVKYIKTGLPVRKGFDPSRISRAEAKKSWGWTKTASVSSHGAEAWVRELSTAAPLPL